MQYTARVHGWTEFVSMQDQYNLMQREEEREMYGLCTDLGVGVIPWSPLGRGRLTRPWGTETTRDGSDQMMRHYGEADASVVGAVEKVAADRGVPMAQIALAWVLNNPVITAPIVGATKPNHLTDAVAALEIELTGDEIAALEGAYVSRPPSYFG